MHPDCLRASWFYHGARCFSFPIFSFSICAFPVEILCRVWYNNCMIRKGVSALALAKSRHRRRQRNRFPWRWVACGLALLYLLFGPSQAGNRIETLMFAAFAVGQVVAWFYLLLYFNSHGKEDARFHFFCEGKVKLWFAVSFAILMLAALCVNMGWLPEPNL